MDFDPTPCKHSGVRLLEIVPPSRGVRVAGEVRSNTFVHPPCPSPSGDDRTDHVPDDDAENGSCDTAHEQAKQADHTAMTRDCLVRWCNITSDRLQVLLLLHRDARGGFVMHPDGDDGANAFLALAPVLFCACLLRVSVVLCCCYMILLHSAASS